MRAMVLEKIGMPLVYKEMPIPTAEDNQVLIKVSTCGVCRTDLHIIEGELTSPTLPLILGHQIVGTIEKRGAKAFKFEVGDRVGVPWLGRTCGACEFCSHDKENLCDHALYTGYRCQGGYAQYAVAHENFIVELPKSYDDVHAAPLLCAGLIGYRALRLSEPFETIGFYGFGSSAHLLIQVAQFLQKKVYVFTRPGDLKTQEFARSLGCVWAGGSEDPPPNLVDSAILFAPDGALIPQALKAVKKGGKVISAGIHMSDIPSFSYDLLWEERSVSSVANLTRKDGLDFMKLLQNLHIQVRVTSFPLNQANEALAMLKNGGIEGSLVLKIL
jgi:propanol-preferring alcohol dehydrogenase